jgi:replicative DNA helicase
MNGNIAQPRKPITIIPDFGKVPPQANDMEEAVLGAALIEKEAVYMVINILKPESFYRESHQKIFKTIIELVSKGFPVDLYTVSEELRSHQELDSIGGPVYLAQLTSKIVSAANVEYHARIVAQKYIQREMIRISTEVQTRAFDDTYDVSELMEYAEKELFQIGGDTSQKDPVKIGVLLNSLAELISKMEQTGKELIGVPSGIISLDRITLGWQAGDLIILAARPSMGKSALAVQFVKFASQLGHPALMFSLEMTDIQVGERYLSVETGQNSYDLKRGRNIDWPKMERILNANKNLPLWIDDSAKMTLTEFRSKVRRAKKKYNIQLVVCDYLNLFTGDADKDNMSEKYGSISKMFKQVAKECKVAVIALAQLNRSPDMRANQFPKLSDLRNSGEIEQDADIVIFPVRYKMVGMLRDERDRDLTNLARIDVAKNRNGKTDVVEVEVSHDCMQWSCVEDTAFPTKDFSESQTSKIPF